MQTCKLKSGTAVTEAPNHHPWSMNVSTGAQKRKHTLLLSHQLFNVIGIQRSVL